MPAGRPLKFETVEAMEELADAYFNSIPEDEWMVTGLALALDTSRETLMNYEKRDEYFDAIKRYKSKVDYAYEKRGMAKMSSFDIFRMKNMGWQDHNTSEVKLDMPKPILGGLSGEEDDNSTNN